MIVVDNKKSSSDRAYYLLGLKIAGDFGATIATPVVVLVMLGQWLDLKYQKTPWFTILGFILSALISAKLIYKKAKKYGEDYKKLK